MHAPAAYQRLSLFQDEAKLLMPAFDANTQDFWNKNDVNVNCVLISRNTAASVGAFGNRTLGDRCEFFSDDSELISEKIHSDRSERCSRTLPVYV
jgi:hypothetical protein